MLDSCLCYSNYTLTFSIFATALFGKPSEAPFDMVILVDPPLFGPDDVNNMTEVYKTVVKTTPSRRSVWESKEEAHEWLKTRLPWKVWDPRVLKLYVVRKCPGKYQNIGVFIIFIRNMDYDPCLLRFARRKKAWC